MKKNEFIYFIEQYYKFRRQLENDINNSQHIVKNVCYNLARGREWRMLNE